MLWIVFSFYLDDVVLIKEGMMRVTSPSLIKREILVGKGEWIDSTKLKEIENRLRDLQLFVDVEVYPADSTADTTDLVVKIKEFWYLWPIINIYKSDETGWNFGIGVSFANFRGMNQKLFFIYNFGGETSYSFSFLDPWTRGHKYHWELSLSKRKWWRNIEEFTQDEKEAGINFGTNITHYLSWTAGLEIKEVRADTAERTVSPSNRDRYVASSIEIFYNTKDSEENPTKGAKHTLSYSYSKGIDPGFSIHEIEAWFRFYKKVFTDDVLAIELGASMNFGEVIPAYRKEYIGGEQTVRGWRYGSLRGNHRFYASVEYRIPLVPIKRRNVLFFKNLRCGVSWYNFYDIGTTADSIRVSKEFLKELSVITSFGAGINIFLPFIQSMRLQLAYADDRWNIGLNAGWRF